MVRVLRVLILLVSTVFRVVQSGREYMIVDISANIERHRRGSITARNAIMSPILHVSVVKRRNRYMKLQRNVELV